MENSEPPRAMSCTKTSDSDMSDNDEDDSLTYEQRRAKRMRENMDLFKTLGITQAAIEFANSIPKKMKNEHKPQVRSVNKLSTVPSRRSLRLANIPPAPDTSFDYKSKLPKIIKADIYDGKSHVFNTESISIPEDDSTFFKKLSTDLIIKEAVNDFHKCNSDRFIKTLKSLELNEEATSLKVVNGRIYSLAVHPSETSLLIAVGGINGSLTIYNQTSSDMREYRIHDRPLNCISFCTWDSHKLFSTSHDGTVRCGDIVKRSFDLIYSSDDFHTTWHTEYERNVLIGRSSGHVDLVDMRSLNKIQNITWCHQESVRTIQCHPLNNHYFLTSSRVGEASLFDIRKMNSKTIDPVLVFKHSKALTSAFFSASGLNMVSTCNDDYIRIFNTSQLTAKATNPVHNIHHNNHTGRWLSVFKAKWNPGRDDAFFVGSMEKPKRIQIYNSNGKLMHNLISESMSTYCPVIEVHPTQAIYVGGNATGRLHIFSTKEQLK